MAQRDCPRERGTFLEKNKQIEQRVRDVVSAVNLQLSCVSLLLSPFPFPLSLSFTHTHTLTHTSRTLLHTYTHTTHAVCVCVCVCVCAKTHKPKTTQALSVFVSICHSATSGAQSVYEYGINWTMYDPTFLPTAENINWVMRPIMCTMTTSSLW